MLLGNIAIKALQQSRFVTCNVMDLGVVTSRLDR